MPLIHGHPDSPYLRSVRLTLEEKGLPYRLQHTADGGGRREAHRQLHPFGRVPVIEHDGYRLYETQAIVRYIDAQVPEPALQPLSPAAIGRMSQIIGINDCYLYPQVGRTIVFQRIVGPALLGTTPDEAVIAAAVPDAKMCLGELDRLLGDQPYLAGDRLSLADLMLAPQLYFIAATPEGAAILAGTALMAWLGRMNARASMRATEPSEALRKAA
jgi:glutathione S-transferase